MNLEGRRKVDEIFRSLAPKKERTMTAASLANLRSIKPKWKNMPSKPIRVPEKFADQLLAIAREWDEDNFEKEESVIDKKEREEIMAIIDECLAIPANKGGGIKKKLRALRISLQDKIHVK